MFLILVYILVRFTKKQLRDIEIVENERKLILFQ